MSDNIAYSSYAILRELNNREFIRKLGLFPEELRYYVILANSIIGTENAKRVKETPDSVVENSKEFVSKLLAISNMDNNDSFREILETYLIETLKDELRYCCSNCANFNKCLDIENLSVGLLFKRCAEGEETDEIKKEISLQVENALHSTPHLDTEMAHTLCNDFRHQYSSSGVGEVFGRYSDIALELQNSYGIDYKKIQQAMISINMDFFKKSMGKKQ
ncbi:MAG: hypothetical protein A2X59_08960 [Nitrospirae bacterium GWC2_42_7]|nr:MAG: hypothetical protein A2X59_08960 [Nitrospirae bacterium GWC2_42_7]